MSKTQDPGPKTQDPGPKTQDPGPKSLDYKTSGVDIDAGNETVRRIKKLAKSTFTPGVLSEIGSFGGLFKLDTSTYQEPVLVSSADGVGTKLKIAFMTNRHRTIGVDLVNHCVNDILVQGAMPLFFLDYLATGKLSPDVAEQIVEGLARGCQENGCALLGGETAEMPGFYADGEYDVAGFIVGVVDRAQIIDGRAIVPGDVLIGLPSNGLHTNGYSLARKVVFESLKLTSESHVPDLGETVGEALLRSHRSYLPVIKPLLSKRVLKGMAHITGGGITDNLPRILPAGTAARVNRTAWRVPAIFRWIGEAGRVPEYDLRRALNMGIGMILVVAAKDADSVRQALLEAGEANSVVIGEIVKGSQQEVQYV